MSNLDLIFLQFPHDNSISLWHTMMILHMCVNHDLTKTSFEIWVERSKSNLHFKLLTVAAQSLLFLSAYNDDISYSYWSLPKVNLYWFQDQNVIFRLQTLHSIALLVKILNSLFERKSVCILCGGAQDFNIWESFSIYSPWWILRFFSIFFCICTFHTLVTICANIHIFNLVLT